MLDIYEPRVEQIKKEVKQGNKKISVYDIKNIQSYRVFKIINKLKRKYNVDERFLRTEQRLENLQNYKKALETIKEKTESKNMATKTKDIVIGEINNELFYTESDITHCNVNMKLLKNLKEM